MRGNSQIAVDMYQKNTQRNKRQYSNEMCQAFAVATIADVGCLLETAAAGELRAVSEAVALLYQLNDYIYSNEDAGFYSYIGSGFKEDFAWIANLLKNGGKTLTAEIRGIGKIKGGLKPSEKALYKQLSEWFTRFAAQFYPEITPQTILGCSAGMKPMTYKAFIEAVVDMGENIAIWLTGTSF